MSRFVAVRWIRGLIPTFVILLLVMCFGLIIFISTFGLPSAVRQLVERELSVGGNVVSMDSLRVSIWSGAVIEANDISVVNEKLGKDAAFNVKKLRVDLDWSSLMNGIIVVDQVELQTASFHAVLTDPKGGNPRALSLDHLDVVALIGESDSVHIRTASGLLQGMKVQVSGDIPLSLFHSSDDSPEMNLDDVRRALYGIVGGIDDFSWKKDSPPVWSVNLSEYGGRGHALRVELDLRAQELAYRGLSFRDFLLNMTYAGDIVQVKKFSCRGDSVSGMIDAEAAVDLSTRKILLDFRSSAPLIRWARELTNNAFSLPYRIELTSNPSVNMSAKIELNETWSKLTNMNVIGEASVGAFKVNQEPFRKFSTNFHYDNGNFYVSDLRIVHKDDAFTGQVMGRGKELLVDVHSSLSADVIVHLIRSFGDNTFKIPNELELRGTPDLTARGTLDFKEGWAKSPEIAKAELGVKLDDFTVRGVTMGSLDLRALVSGKKVELERCVLKRRDEELNLSGKMDGRDVSFAVKSSFPIQIFNQLLPGMIDFPKELTVPTSLLVDAEGSVLLKDGGGISLQKLTGSLAAGGIGWNGVVFSNVAVEGSYGEGKIDVKSLRLDQENRFVDVAVKGDLEGDLQASGRSTLGLLEWDRLMALGDDDFFFKRFKVSDKSLFDLSFQAEVSMADPLNHYSAEATLHAENAEYLGVVIQKGDASAKIVPGNATLSNVSLVYDNTKFLGSRKIKNGVASSALKADSIEFDFKSQTVAVKGMLGTVYPDYVMNMFSPVAADVLNDFLFTRPVKISGGGVFPLEDDFSKMKGVISFVASSGEVEYPLIGTVLKMTESSGNISFSPEWVMVEKLKGKIWGGTFDGKIGARIDKGSDLNGLLVLQSLDLSKIGASYDKKMNPARVFGSITFKSSNASLNSIVAHGSAQLYDGNLVEIPLFGQLGKAISSFIPGVGHLVNYNITSATCDYAIEDGFIKSNSFDAKGTNMSLLGGGWIRLSDQQVTADFKLGLRGLPGLFTTPIFLVAGGFFNLSGTGPLNDIGWTLAPFSSLKMAPEVQPKKEAIGSGKKDEKTSRWKFWK